VRELAVTTIEEQLEVLFAKVRGLSKERQELAVSVFADIVEETVYELAILKPALEHAERGEFVSDAEISEVLNKPWK
jgi:hypothetical protein